LPKKKLKKLQKRKKLKRKLKPQPLKLLEIASINLSEMEANI
jgi:hypothetical protein